MLLRFLNRFSLVPILMAGLLLFHFSLGWASEDLAVPQEQKEKQQEKQQGEEDEEEEGYFTRRQKTIMLNAGAMGAIAVWGFFQWDYGKEKWSLENEGWFGRTTAEGGADKLGHFWSSYALSHLLARVYRSWDYSESEANLYGALSSFGIQGFMELADGVGGHGTSYEDLLMNFLGAGVGYIWGKYPSLADKIAFRVEYKPSFRDPNADIFTDYQNMKFLMAIKADGFDWIKDDYLKYLELHVGYFTRGYEGFSSYTTPEQDDRRRKVFVGVGFSVNKLAKKYLKTRVFDYLQLPYTSITFTYNLDD